MNFKGNLKYLVTGAVIFMVAYVFIAASPIGPDLYLQPVWTRDVSALVEPGPDANLGSDAEAFVLKDRFGYFSSEGKLLAVRAIEDRVTASSLGWARYGEGARDVEIMSPAGKPIARVPGSGFLHLDEDRAFLFLPGGDAVSQIAPDGATRWTREHPAPITAFDSSSGGTVLGYADGTLACVGPDGSPAFSFSPGGSEREVILGAAISPDGKLVACVSGLRRQRFILVAVTPGQHKVVFHEYLDDDLRREVFVGFSRDGRRAFYERSGGLSIVDTRDLSSLPLDIDGRIEAIEADEEGAVILVLSSSGKTHTLSVVEPPNHRLATARFQADDAFMALRGASIYLGSDRTVSRLDIRGLR